MKNVRSKMIAGLLAAGLLAAGLLAPGCRVEPGETDYESQQIEDFMEPDSGEPAVFLPGPDPYVAGDSRLTFGPFYEGAQSEEIPINDQTNFFFVFDAGGISSLEITMSTDRIEGFQSSALQNMGTPFWGMSLAFFDGNPDDGASPRPEDLSAYETMHISFKSSDATYDEVSIGIESQGGQASVFATDYGYAADGEWHTLDIPLEDFGVDLTTVTTPLVLSGEQGTEGDFLLVDNFYYSGP